MKKLLLAATALGMIAGAAASADAAVAVGVGIASPGYYYAPAPAPVYYDPAPRYYYGPWGYDRKRDYDWYYWNRPGYHRHWVDNGWRNGVYVRGHWE